MGLWDGVVGGAVGAGVATVLNDFIRKQGGVRGVLSQFEKQGLGPTVRSWISTGENHPISADQIQRAVGYENLQKLGAQLGLTVDQAAAKLAEHLPAAINKLTPRGTV